MQYLLYGVLGIYSLPMVGVIVSALWSGLFSSEEKIVYIVAAISGTHLELLRGAFGYIIVPIVTAYSVQIGSAGQSIPCQTKRLFVFLIALFVLSLIFYGIIVAYKAGLKHYSEDIFNSFRDITISYSKEALVYIALTFGISLKRGS